MWNFLVLVLVILVEIALFVVIGDAIGLWLTLAWVVLAGALGVILLKGIASMGAVSISRDLYEFRDAASVMPHQVLVAIAGTLLLIPGFLTDAVGLLLLFAPVRRAVIGKISRRYFKRPPPVVIDGEWQEARGDADPTPPPRSTRH